MGIFDIFGSNSKELPIDLTDFRFVSDDHIRYENGQERKADNKGAMRGVRIQTSDNKVFSASIYNMSGIHPVWGNNVQMAPKQMKIIDQNSSLIKLRGFGVDAMGSSFADYGISLHLKNKSVEKATLHMHDRNVDIVYLKADQNTQQTNSEPKSEFQKFKEFTDNWRFLSQTEQWQIAGETDRLNNIGANFYRQDNMLQAIAYFQKAIEVMPNNDDALKNLKICYNEIGEYDEAREMERRLAYV
ncbi:tetratricopeptide repeat protein [Nonlabens sp. SY33080]|uniref:tetratricopeptide repeat protein n=1 Tax=Nonlabens sp. SY33080 TaxID=2719911 RepID=UPI0014288A25|nr:tetratricopeptide repeat protein [Nonlabens sp. SY33080]